MLHHGSIVKFGCLQFVFSIVDTNSEGKTTPDAVKTPELSDITSLLREQSVVNA